MMLDKSSESWRRAGDSNSETPCGVMDFKFVRPLPSPCRHRSSSLLIMPLRGALAGQTVPTDDARW